jgi:hypothetical protein
MIKHLLVALFCLASVGLSASEKPSVYVGLRDPLGFSAPGVRDSVRDLRAEFSKAGFPLREQPDAAINVFVITREAVEQSKVTVGSADHGSVYLVPIPVLLPTLTLEIEAHDVRRPSVSVGSTWRSAAKATVRDVLAWVNQR